MCIVCRTGRALIIPIVAFVGWVGLVSVSLAQTQPATVSGIPNLSYQVIASYPHDSDSFTQGLLFLNGKIFESAGRYGHSDVRMADLKTGKVLARQEVSQKWFAEGLARIDQRLYQLTWKAGIGIIYRLPFLKAVGQFKYSGEGWGLAFNDQHLVMSDGTDTLRFLDPRTFAVVRTLKVQANGRSVDQLNELEVVEGVLFANIWGASRIARIDLKSGQVTGWLELEGLYKPKRRANVLNGIAWDPVKKHLLVTGKFWPKVYALNLVP